MQPDSLIPDPANPQSWNRYSYVYNNPIRYTDPTGHCIAPGTQWTCPIQVSTGLPGWVSIGIEVIAAVTIGIIAGNATADWQKDWQLHDPKKNDRQNMEDGLGWTANSNNTFIWRGKPNNEPKGICNTPSKFMKCLGVGLGFGDIIREAVNCFADGGACVDEKQPGQLVLQTSSSTPTLTITPSVTLTPNCSPPYQQCNATMTATFTVTQTSTSTATPTNTAIPSPTSTPTIKPSPIRTLRTLMPY